MMNTRSNGRTHNWFGVVGLLIALLLMGSCSYSEEKAIEQSAVSFAQKYFNLHYCQALSECTPESEKWVRLKASNITQEDLDILNTQADSATCTVELVEFDGDSATTIVEVCNFLNCDSIGKPGAICSNAKFKLTLKKIGKQWKVDIQSPIKTSI